MTAADIVLLVTAGFVGGIFNAVAGGGSLIVFPALLATGLGPLAANVTNSIAQLPSYVGGVLGFRAELAGQRGRLTRLSLTAVLGAIVGSALLLTLPAAAFDAVVPILVLLASLLLAVQPWVKRLVGDAPSRREGRRVYAVTFVAAIYGGYFGGALGVILVGALALTLNETLRRINALKSALSLIIAGVTVVAFGIFGPVHWSAVAVIAPAALTGGYVGARVARRINDTVLRWCVVVFGIAVAVYLFATG